MAILLGFPGMSLANLDLELLHFGTLKYIYMYVCYVNVMFNREGRSDKRI